MVIEIAIAPIPNWIVSRTRHKTVHKPANEVSTIAAKILRLLKIFVKPPIKINDNTPSRIRSSTFF